MQGMRESNRAVVGELWVVTRAAWIGLWRCGDTDTPGAV